MEPYELKEIEYENEIAPRYNRDYHEPLVMKMHDQAFVEYAGRSYHENDRVLDLGCGPASLWTYWKNVFRNPKSLTGVDLSEGMIGECKKMYPRDDFRAGSALKIPLPDGSIDLVIASSVLHHMPDEKLPEAFKEIHRVLDEHGALVGREPLSKGRLGDESSWLSGAVMSFRHLVYRLTHTREYPEPSIGEHHHAYDPQKFIEILRQFFPLKGVSMRHPVSSFVARCNHPLVAQIVQLLDERIEHRGGHEFFYVAQKNYTDAKDVAYCVEQELEQNENGLKNPDEFLALLQQSAEILEKELEDFHDKSRA